MKKWKSDEDGAIMLEGVFAMAVVLAVMALMISLGFYLYQRTIVCYIANEVAEEIAQTYKYPAAGDASEVMKSDLLHGAFYSFRIRKSSYEEANKNKANAYVQRRLPATTLAKMLGEGPEVTITQIGDDIGRAHYEIKVTGEYQFLMGGALELLGMKGTQKVTYVSYAEAVDISSYISDVKLKTWLFSELDDIVPAVGMINSVISFVSSFGGLFNTLAERAAH